MPNRIGENCWYKVIQNGALTEYQEGTILAWSTDHEVYEESIGLFPVAVIEDGKTGEVKSVYVELVRFSV